MSPRRPPKPLTLLLLSLLCYGFVMVWTEKATLETTTHFEKPGDPESSLLPPLNVLTGGNYSVTVSPGDGTSALQSASVQSNPATQSTTNEDTKPLPLTSGGVTSQLPTTAESLSNAGGTETPSNATSAINKTNTGSPENTTEGTTLDNRTSATSGELHDAGGCTQSQPSGDGVGNGGCVDELSGATTTNSGTGAITTDTSPPMKSLPNQRAVKRATSALQHGGRMSWRVTLQSSLSREEAVTAFFERACDLIQKMPNMKDVVIIWGPNRDEMSCTQIRV